MRMSKRARRRATFAAVAFVVLIGAGVGVREFRAHQEQRLVAQARERGEAAYARGDFVSALEHLSYYVQHKKDDPEAAGCLLKFADARRQIPLSGNEHLREAVGLYQHARRLLDGHPDGAVRSTLGEEANEGLLELYGRLGMRTELLETAGRLRAGNPDHRAALAAEAEALYGERSFAGAAAAVERLIELEPGNLRWRHMKLRIMRAQKAGEAEILAQCDGWIAMEEGDGGLRLLKAGWLAEMGRVDEARATAERAAELGAGSLEILEQMVALLDMLGLQETASGLLGRAEAQFPGEQWVQETAVRRLWHAGDVEGAERELARAEGEFGALGKSLLRVKAMVLAAEQRQEEARAALAMLKRQEGAEKDGRADAAWAEAMSARLGLSEGTWRSAVGAAEAALALQPEDASLHYILGEAQEMVGERAGAVESYRRAYRLEPSWLAAGVKLADALLAVGRAPEAFEVASELVRSTSEHRLAVYVVLARASISMRKAGASPVLRDAGTGRAIDVADVMAAIQSQYGDRAELAGLLLEAYFVSGRRREAEAFVDGLLADEAASAEVLVAAGAVCGVYEPAPAAELIGKAAELDGWTIPVAAAQAELLAKERRFDEGLALLDEAIARSPEERRQAGSTHRARCAYLLRMDHPRAAEALRDLVRDWPRSVAMQTFALSQPAAWDDEALVGQAIGNLRSILGDEAGQVRLAEANLLLRFDGEDDGQRARAMVMIGEVLERSPGSLPALILMAEASLGGGHPSLERATEHLERAVDLAPGRAVLYERLIPLLEQKGDYAKADQYLRRLGGLAERDGTARGGEMRLLYARGDFEEALVRASETVDETSAVRDQLILAALHAQAGEEEKAERIYERLLASGEAEELVLSRAAEFYAQVGGVERGLALLEGPQAEHLAPVSRATLIGLLYQRHGEAEEAERWLKEAVRAAPGSCEAQAQLARFYLGSGQFGAAYEAARRGLELDAQHAGLRTALAMAGLALGPEVAGDPAQVLGELDEADELVATLALLGTLRTEDGMMVATDESVAQAKRLVEDHGRFLPAWQLAIALHRQADRRSQAVELARRAVSRFPARPEPSQWATALLSEYRRWDEALVEAQEWRRRSTEDALPADAALASILLHLRRSGEAYERVNAHVERIVEERGAAPERLVLWLQASVRSGHIDRAWERIGPLVEEDASWRVAWLGLAESAEYEAAREVVSRYERIAFHLGTPAVLQAAQSWCGLGWRFDDRGSFDRAERLAAERPTEPELTAGWRFLRGRVAEGKADLEEAARWYRAVGEGEPEHRWALNNLAFVLAQMPGRAEEAVESAERGLALEPDHPDMLATYARALAAAGRAEAACRAMDRAVAGRPGDVTLRLAQVELLMETGGLEEARAAYRIARRQVDGLELVPRSLQRRIERAERRLEETRAAVEP